MRPFPHTRIAPAIRLPLARLATALLLAAAATGAQAQSAVMVEAGNQILREDIQWLIDRGIIDLTTSTWPLPLAALEHALASRKQSNLNRADQTALLTVESYVASQKKGSYGVVGHYNSDAVPQLGFAQQARGRATGGVYLQAPSGRITGRLQANALSRPLTGKQASGNLEGSYVAGSALGQVVYAGVLNHWWGPGTDGSVNWGNSATAMPGIGIQRAQQTAFETPWLSWIGPWGYHVFAGQMQHDTSVPQARVINMRVFVRPFSNLELGASRFIQWGGSGRPDSFKAFWNAVTGNSNEYDPGKDPSNELSGFDARLTFPIFGNPFTLYGQVAGEDEAGSLPSKYIALAGLQFKHAIGSTRVQWHAESADTMARRVFGLRDSDPNIAYNHFTYRNGLYHDGLPMGHGIGGDGRMHSVGVSIIPDDTRNFLRYSARLLHAEVNPTNQTINQAFPSPDKWYAGEVSVSWAMRPATFRAGLVLMRSTQGNLNDRFSVMLSANVPLGSF